jgi:hypothetical protein
MAISVESFVARHAACSLNESHASREAKKVLQMTFFDIYRGIEVAQESTQRMQEYLVIIGTALEGYPGNGHTLESSDLGQYGFIGS